MSFLDKLTTQLPFGKKSEIGEYFFALNITNSEVTSVVWGITDHKLNILGQAHLPYHDTEDLLVKANSTLDRALGAFETEPKKVLFGVPESWSTDDNLKEPYLKLLRRMVKEFDLEPLAYVTTPVAIGHLLEKQEGVPPTVVLLGVGDFVEVTLLRGGKVVETKTVKREGRFLEDVEKALAHLTEVEVLPSRILIYPTSSKEDLNQTRDELMSYPWMSKFPFLHFPKIDLLEEGFPILAVVAGGAVELDSNIDLKHLLTFKKMDLPEGKGERKFHTDVLKSREEDLGFVRGDVKRMVQPIQEKEKGDSLVSVSQRVEEFSKSDDLSSEEETAFPLRAPLPPETVTFQRSQTKNKLLSLKNQLSAVTTKLSKSKFKSLFHFKVGAGKFVLGGSFIFLLIFAYLLLVKASVTVYVEPRILEKDTQVIADPKVSSVDEGAKIIPATTLETSVSGSEKGEATGQKQIGNPARGKVVVYNLSSSKVSLSQGTVLTSGTGLKFTLDTSVQVASQSSSIGSDFTTITKAGKSDLTGVTASEIGPESNLAAGTDLTIAGFNKSQAVARVEEALSGGTSKNVTVVTSDDQKRLQAKVIDSLRQKVLEEMQAQVPAEKKIVPEALTVADGKYSFSKQVNDQASEFTLNATVRFKGTAYSDTDLRTIVSKLIETNVPDNFALNLQDMETQADVSKVEKDGKLIFTAKFRAKLLPKLDIEELKRNLRGRSSEDVINYLKGLENVIGSEIKMMPNLPDKVARLPLWDKNITITISPK